MSPNKNGSKVNVGIIYRSPNGNAKDFRTELLHLISNFPKNMTTAILGDFNFNLIKSDNVDTELFEVMFLSQGLFPLISLPTHSTSDKQSSCIDNILTNNIEAVSMSGVICDKGTHHSPIFALFNLNLNKSTPKTEKLLLHYSFSKKNVESLVEDLELKFLQLCGPPDCPDFENFFAIFTETIDKHCKLEKPKISKRNQINSPWITDSIIDAIDHKEELYEAWTNSKAHNKKGDEYLYEKFSRYRKCLKHVIKCRKNIYYNDKILEHSGNRKKPGKQLIN